jgi:hypothetical protein
MFSLLNPSVIGGLILCLIGTFFYGHHSGYKEREAEDEAVIAQKNQDMTTAKEKSDAALHKAQTQLANLQSKRNSDIAAGNQRLFVRLAAPADNAAPAAGNDARGAQLDPEFAATLVGPTDRGDQIIVKYNACIKQYNEMREVVNGKR